MSDKEKAQDVITSYRKRQKAAQKAPLLIGAAAVLLVIGAAIIIFWLLNPGKLKFTLFPSATPSPTITGTPTNTPTETPLPSETPTITMTPTESATSTASGPFPYTVLEGDTLSGIAEKYNVDLLTLIAINNLDSANPIIRVGDQLTIPGPDTKLPTETPVSPNVSRGTRIEYTIKAGDSIASIADKFFSTVDDILTVNKLDDPNKIFVGQKIIVRVNIATRVPSSPTSIATVTGTVAASGGTAPTATKTP